MLTLIASILVFGVLVIAHEAGHFAAAKAVGIRVNEFSVGFGTRLAHVKRGETEYSLRLLPLGGYVKMEGEDGRSDDRNSFTAKPVWARALTIFSGPLMNLVLAGLLLSIVTFYLGVPQPEPVIGVLESGGPAATAGLKTGDRVLSIDGLPIRNWTEMVKYINSHPDQAIRLTVIRNGEKHVILVTPKLDPERKVGIIGIGPVYKKYQVLSSIGEGFRQTAIFISTMVGSLIMMITRKIAPDVVGPVGIVTMVGEAARVGILNLIFFAAIISINLGIINLLPIPALDGSRLVFLLVEAVRGKPIDPEKEGFVHFVGFALLMILMAVIIWKDLLRFNIL